MRYHLVDIRVVTSWAALALVLGSCEPVTTPVAVRLGALRSLAAGYDFTCAVTAVGAAYCWGSNTTGNLGNGSMTTQWGAKPLAVAGGLTFTAVSLGEFTACGLTVSGAAYCWGDNFHGQLGDGSTAGPQQCDVNGQPYPCGARPVAVAGALSFTGISPGPHSCGVTTGGAAYCWGCNLSGELGDGSTAASAVPVAVAGGIAFAMVGVGGDHSCGVTPAGAAYCWGANTVGQLGDGTLTASAVPTLVSGGLAFSSVSAGGARACGVTASGAAYCWGENGDGSLGNGTTASSSVPVPVTGGLTFKSVSVGAAHTCGVTTAGTAYCWGRGSSGQLGNGATLNSPVPVAVSGGITFAAVSAGTYHSCGLRSDGGAYCWGASGLGQLGGGTAVRHSIPVRVSDP